MASPLFSPQFSVRTCRWIQRISWCLLALITSVLIHVWINPSSSNAMAPPPSQLVQQGREAYQLGQYTDAIAPLQQAVQTYTERHAPLNQALALSYLALVYQELGDRPQAETTIHNSVTLVPSDPDSDPERQIQAQVFNTQGELHFTWGQLQDAVISWQTAISAYEALNDETGRIGTEINQIQALRALGHYRQAARRITALQAHLETLPNSVLSLTAWRSLGNTLAAMGQIRTGGAQPEIDQNQRLTAQTALAKSLDIAQQLESTADIAAAYLSLGNVEQVRGDRLLNQYLLSQLRSLMQQSTCPTQRIQTWSDRLTPNQTNPYQTALSYYDQVSVMGGEGLPRDIQVRSRLNSLSLAIALEPETIPERISILSNQLQQLAPGRFAAYAHIHLAQDFNCWARAQTSLAARERSTIGQSPQDLHQKAIDHLKVAIAMAQELGDRRAESYAWGELGALYAEQVADGDASIMTDMMAHAKITTERAMTLAQQLQAPDITYRWQWQMGKLLNQEGKPQEAILYYTQAFENLKALRADLTVLDTDIQFSFREQIEPLYREFADLLLRSPASTPLALSPSQPAPGSEGKEDGEISSLSPDGVGMAKGNGALTEASSQHMPSQVNLKQARDVLEALQLAELDNFFQDACSDVESQSLDTIIDEQSPHSVVLYTILLDQTSSQQENQRLDLILKLPNDSLRYYSTAVSSSEVRRVALDFRQQLTRPHTSPALTGASQTLYQWLIQPIEADLASHHIDHIVLVLDGVLRNVPMAALYDGQGFVGDRYAISLAPGLQLLKTNARARASTTLLAAGLSDSREGFPPLPNVEKELAQITAVIPTTTQLLNQQFTQSELETAVKRDPISILHLATHGQFSSQADNTFLLAYDDRININELHELLSNRGQPSSQQFIDLLVLSACQTASGDERAVLGLAGVAVRAGARSTLASLWSVDDQATALLVSEFYRQLYNDGQGLRKVEALQRAQQYVRDFEVQGIRPYAHPRYWAAFVLLGNWS